jgi:hypothetical protein
MAIDSLEVGQIRDALNRHGVFLKKAVLAQLQATPGLRVLGEEMGTTFGETRVADVVTHEDFAPNVVSRLIFECKRVDPGKRWVFFRHMDSQHRINRLVRGHRTSFSNLNRPSAKEYPVCSEGYECGTKKEGNLVANQDPVFKAAAQLTAAFLGFVRELVEQHGPFPRIFCFAAILVTTAPLTVAEGMWTEVPPERWQDRRTRAESC